MGNTLDQAYDQGGAGAGRKIVADAGPVTIDGNDGLNVAGDAIVRGEISALAGISSNGFHTDGRELALSGRIAFSTGDRPGGGAVLKLNPENNFPGGVDIYARTTVKGALFGEGGIYSPDVNGFYTDGRQLALGGKIAFSTGDRPDGAAVLKLNPENNYSGGIDIYARTTVKEGLIGEGGISTTVLTITGGSDLAEPFEVNGTHEAPPGSLLVIDDENPGQLKLSDRAYDSRVAGIISGAGGIQPGIALSHRGARKNDSRVALSGRVYCLADASNNAIMPGDLMTTSSRPGFAMKADDWRRARGAIVGKAMSRLDQGTGLVLVLVSLQ